MNTYSKYVPNVFLAKCSEKHEKGEVIEVTTKYGKENECIVFNLIYEYNRQIKKFPTEKQNVSLKHILT